MKDKGKVSIIIPNYNNAQYLKECIESAINQTYSNKEIIIVDDCSTDNSYDIISEFKNQYKDLICVHKNTENLGVSASLNLAISLSNGDFISWLSSDDIYLPYKVAINIDNLTDNIGFVYSDFYYINEESSIISRANVREYSNIKAQMYNDHWINGCSVLFRKSLLNTVGLFDLEVGGKSGHAADSMMWHKMSYICHYFFINMPLVCYRIHKNSLSNNLSSEFKFAARLQYQKKMIEWVRKYEDSNNSRS